MRGGTAEARSAVRLADIAREVGVSIVTVAKVVNNTGGKNTRVSEKTAEKIRSCVKRMEYHPNMLARGLVGKSSDLIGVVLDREAATLAGLCLKQNLVVLTAGETVLRLLPRLNLTRAEADEGIARISAALEELNTLIQKEQK